MDTNPCTPAAHYRGDGPRSDGWTPERQARFLLTLADSGLVSEACRAVGMSPSSAYAQRRRAEGLAFALGWKAAHLLARDRLEDMLLEAAIAGVETVTTREDGVTRRRSVNSGLSMAVLNRLDRHAAALDNDEAGMARAIGSAFDDYVELVRKGAGVEDVARFLAVVPDPLALKAGADDGDEAEYDDMHELVEKSALYSGDKPGARTHDPRTAGHRTRSEGRSPGPRVHSGYF